MKAQLKYPIFSFAPKGNMIYVFRKEELYTTTNTKLLKKRKNYIVVDATGTKYVEKGAHKVKWQGMLGYCIRMQGRVISIEYEYGDNPEPFPLRKLQELVAERYPKTRWFKEECWNSADEFRQVIFACKTRKICGIRLLYPEIRNALKNISCGQVFLCLPPCSFITWFGG